jgi:hypothetical protein
VTTVEGDYNYGSNISEIRKKNTQLTIGRRIKAFAWKESADRKGQLEFFGVIQMSVLQMHL